jgi:hypothetical protein
MLPGNDRRRVQTAGPRPGQRSETIRRANLSAIVRELHLRGPMSRSDLVEHTGLTRSGIRAVINDLVSLELVSEERAPSQGAPGRLVAGGSTERRRGRRSWRSRSRSIRWRSRSSGSAA